MDQKIRVKKTADSRTAYLKLPGYPDEIIPGVVAKSISLDDLYDYDGPRVQLDFNKEGKLIGIEVVS